MKDGSKGANESSTLTEQEKEAKFQAQMARRASASATDEAPTAVARSNSSLIIPYAQQTLESILLGIPESEALASEEPESKFGCGAWWFPKSNETYDPKHPFRRLLKVGERDTFDTITNLVSRTQNAKYNLPGSWIIRMSASYLSKQCGGNPAPRTIEQHLATFLEVGLLALFRPDKENGNSYLVSSSLMQSERAMTFRYSELAKRLADKFRLKTAPERVPQVRDNKKVGKVASSRAVRSSPVEQAFLIPGSQLDQ